MGKVPYYPDSETDASSIVEIPKKKKKFSILKYTKRSVKKKCKAHSLPDLEPEPEYPANKKLRGILKHEITKELPVLRKMSSLQRREMFNQLSVLREKSPLAQEYISQFLLNKELRSSETQFPEYKREPRCEIIYEHEQDPGTTYKDSASMTWARSDASQGSFVVDEQQEFHSSEDRRGDEFCDSEDRNADDANDIQRCLMVGLVIGRALTCMPKKKRNKCIFQLSHYFNLPIYESFTDYRNSDLYSASDEDLTDLESPLDRIYPVGKCLVGHVPRPPGARPGHCGGVALIVRKNPKQYKGALRAQASISGAKARESMMKKIQKKSY